MYKKYDKYSLLIYIVWLFLQNSCVQPEKKQHRDIIAIKPNIEKIESPDSWELLLKDVDFTILESTDGSIITQINKLTLDKRYIYILDKNRVIIFDNEGNFIKNLPKNGKGPGEAIKIHDFCIDEDNNLYILAEGGKILMYHALEFTSEFQAAINGNAVKPINFQIENGSSFYWMDRFGYSSLSGTPERLLYEVNSQSNELNSFFIRSYFSSKMSRFNQSNQENIITPPIGSDTLYLITANGLQPEIAIDFGKYSIIKSNNKISNEVNDPYALLSDLHRNRLVGELMFAVKNGNYLSLLFPNPIDEKYCNLLIEKTTGKSYVIAVKPSENLFYPGIIFSSYNNQMISAKESFLITDCMKRGLNKCSFISEERRIKLLEKLQSVKETDNPVIMKMTIKE